MFAPPKALGYLSVAASLTAILYGDIDVSGPIAEIIVKTEDGFFAMREVQLIGRGVPTFKAKAYNGLGHDWDFPIFSFTYEGHPPQDQSNTLRIEQSFIVTCGVPFGFGQSTFPPGTRAKDQKLDTTFIWGSHLGTNLETRAESLKNAFFTMSKTDWPKGHGCNISQELDFPLFAVDKYEIKLVGGTQKPTEEEKVAEEERKRLAAEERKGREAAEAARQKRLAAERKRKQSDEDASFARAKAEQDAKAAEERAKIRAACKLIYEKTADKRIGDLTVKESQLVQLCQMLGLYPP